MIVTVRLEAEGSTLDEVVKDIDAAAKAVKVPEGLHVHDEHYGREQTGLYSGRRVYKFGPPQVAVKQVAPSYWNNITSGNQFYLTQQQASITAAHPKAQPKKR